MSFGIECDARRRTLGAGSVLVAITLAHGAAWAQSPGTEPLEAVMVTSEDEEETTAAPSDADSMVPMTVLDRALLETAGSASLGDVLQQLSWQSNALNTQFNNGGDGTTRLSLRGLNPGHTLVLVNGRRHVSGGSGGGAFVDLNAIPLALVERVEIVRGPAAVHGSGAIGGVVNIVTRDDLDGVEAALFTGTTPDQLGTAYDVSAAMGHRFDRGRIMVAAGYHEQQAISAGDREFSRTDVFYNWPTGETFPTGSSAVPQGYIYDRGEGPGNATWQDLVSEHPGPEYYNDPAVGWRSFDGRGNSDTGQGDLYNYQPENHLITPQRRYHGFAAGEYELSDEMRVFFEASYLNRRSEQRLASVPLFTVTEGITVSADNVYNPFGRDFIDIRRRVVEAGPRRFQQDVDTMRLVAGVAGALGHWDWDLTYGYGSTESTERALGGLRRDRLAAALGPSYFDASGTPQCGTPDAPGDPGCVPVDIFGGTGTITPEMVDYVRHDTTGQGFNHQHLVALRAGGDLVRAPSGAGAALHLGAEYRDESGGKTPDPLLPDTTNNNELPFEGSRDVRAAHAELSVVPITGDDLHLELGASGRAFEYSSFGRGMTWQLGGMLRLGGGVAVRGSQAQAMSAPSISSLYSAGQESFPSVTDPCDTAFGPRTPNEQANCAADGLPDNYVDSRTQIRARTGGGSPELQAELADVRSAGVVFAPDFAPGLSVSADYFDIAVRDVVTTLGAGAILSNCYNSAPDQRTDCDQITRDPDTGFLELISDSLTNRGRVETSGVDVQLAYDSHTALGRFSYHLGGTWLLAYDVTDPDGTVTEGKGVYDLGVHPERRLDLAVLWESGPLGAGVRVRHIGSFTECQENNCQGLDSDVSPPSREVASYTTADLSGSYSLGSSMGRTRLAVGVRNLLDQKPPAVYNGFLATSDASAYDFTGRYVFARLVQQF